MDTQNKTPQNLSPELKQIYDRVMNTPAKGAPNTTPPPPVSSVPTPQTAAPAPITVSTTSPAPQGLTPSATANPIIILQPPTQSADLNQPFLTSTPPRPLQGSVGVKTFSMGKENKEVNKPEGAIAVKKGISKTLIIILAAVFFAAWTFFWVIFFFNPFS